MPQDTVDDMRKNMHADETPQKKRQFDVRGG